MPCAASDSDSQHAMLTSNAMMISTIEMRRCERDV